MVKTYISEEIEEYARDHTRPEPAQLISLIAKTHATMDNPQMLTGRVEGRFLKLLVQIAQPRLALEIGMFTGYSALSMAEGLPADGRIITCDIDPKARDLAQAAFDASPVGHKIEVRMGPAIDTIRQLGHIIDFAFIDADKKAYPQYYEEILARTRPGGLILLDNMFLSGRVLDPHDDTARALAKLNQDLARDDRIENVLLTIRDGVQLIRKK